MKAGRSGIETGTEILVKNEKQKQIIFKNIITNLEGVNIISVPIIGHEGGSLKGYC